MVSFSHERRSGRDRRSGGDRRQLDRRQPRESEESYTYEEDPEKVVEMTAHLGEVWYAKGRDLFDRNEHEDAEKAFKKALDIRPDIGGAWFLLACIESSRGRKNESLSMLAKAVELEPEYKDKAKSHTSFRKVGDDGDFLKIVR
ncbi:MAG: tetratricopeptide repeat protein [Deltaproteobacteria bacterium]|nr:tetratricopeptide repeat protein [Deltaproteobacteria bacterium]